MIRGRCHCGAQRFSAPAPDSVTECDCSICSRRGGLWAYYDPAEVTLETTPETLAAYQWGDRMMTFHHCQTCGCSVFNDAPAWTREDGVDMPARIILNARLFEDFDLAAAPVRRIDGRSPPPLAS
ncbi:GFA family protein [Brevundimonas sp. Root1279]|uniref:GFA family protein n=1 Tax=Brevundimonas sp. Root1279 TaxID=1736443 RepID=UPI001F17DACC|nr:GFA family protein [Brevundimonas sp. Root1279]